MVASSTSESDSIATGDDFLPLKREETLSMAELSWLSFAFKVCLVFYNK